MARKTPAKTRKKAAVMPAMPPTARLRGRPPLPPRTELARWIQQRSMTVVDFTAKLRSVAPEAKLHPDDAPLTKTLLDAVNGRHWPSLKTVLLVRLATGGDVDVEHWVRDLSTTLS